MFARVFISERVVEQIMESVVSSDHGAISQWRNREFSTSDAAQFLGSSFISFPYPYCHRPSGTSRHGTLQYLGPASDVTIRAEMITDVSR